MKMNISFTALICYILIYTVLGGKCYLEEEEEDVDVEDHENDTSIEKGLIERCYPPFGCFNNKPPYDNTRRIPVEPKELGLHFALFNRQNKDLENPIFLNATDPSTVNSSLFVKDKGIKVIIHGFTGSFKNEWVSSMTKDILSAEDVNVICVDWCKGAKNKLKYQRAAANTRLVGKIVAVLLTTIHNTIGTAYYDMHIIGHSLGSHIAGYVGRFLPGQLGRISGMDPARPRFAKFDCPVRLDTSDALFVDVIHTSRFLGASLPMGDLDFYPNDGKSQPGCEFIIGCSHSRAIDLYISSINNTFYGYRCNSYKDFKRGLCLSDRAIMGYWAKPEYLKSNILFLKTTGAEPFVI